MTLLRDLVQEMAAGGSTGAGGIAAVPGSLFSGGVVDAEKNKQRRKKMMRRVMNMKESLGVDLGRTDFDASDVISRIDAASKKADQNDDTTAFGLEDEDGNMVKVYVRNDQSEDFEKELSALLAGELEDDEEDNNALEIAEVLFKLKDKFDIIDVEWPGIEGDTEEEQEVGGAEAGGPPAGGAGAEPQGAEGDLGGAEGAAETGDLEGIDTDTEGGDEEAMAPDEAGAETALQQVIDMMKADAEAKKAEADARAAEARAKEAEYTAQASAGRVRKEEQMMDMEAAEKAKKEQEEEAKKMAKLARYQYQNAQDAEVKLSMEAEDKEDGTYDQPWKLNDEKEDEKEITLKELSYLIMQNLGHNQ